jgi:cyanophycinase
MKAKGTLIPIGGNEDKGVETADHYKLEYIEEGILARVVKESGGPKARIVIIPTASNYPVEVGENYLRAFGKLGCTNLHVLDIRKKKQAEEAENIEMVRSAHCIMFSGGNQSKITKIIGRSTLHDLLLKKYTYENFVIAGTSAGAMCMAEEMIAGGSSTEAFFKGTVRMSDGMGFVPNLIIDSHFIRRGRFGRLAEAVAKYPKLIGVGLAEDTGLVIKECKTFEVIGSGMVVLFDPRKLKHNNEEILEEGTPMSLVNLKTHVLANGDRFNLKEKKVKVLPVEAPFV